jgi:hypothetical protein
LRKIERFWGGALSQSDPMKKKELTRKQVSFVMLPALDSQELRIQELASQRKLLSEQFKSNPRETHLALKLKIVDDQISEWNQQIQSIRDDHREARCQKGEI